LRFSIKIVSEILATTKDDDYLQNSNKQEVVNFAKSHRISVDIVLDRLAHENEISWKNIANSRKKLTIKI